MVYILSALIKKAIKLGPFSLLSVVAIIAAVDSRLLLLFPFCLLKTIGKLSDKNDEVWKQTMLVPEDYNHKSLFDKDTRSLMEKITFSHGGKEYDEKYPDGSFLRVMMSLGLPSN
jgi:hypothetical protein